MLALLLLRCGGLCESNRTDWVAVRAGRDFKPSNILVGDDGRVRLTDFGLARAAKHLRFEPPAGATHRAPFELERPLTREGVTVGTPAFMAPEQHRATVADELSDQFSFCVALYEALCGRRPFSGRDPAQRLHEIRSTNLERAPGGPAWLLDSIAVGLRAEPNQRHASLAILIDSITRQRRRRARRRRWMVAAFASSLGSARLSLA